MVRNLLYDRWTTECLPAALPKEPFATCDKCAMCVGTPTSLTQISFRPDTKCCTFIPRLTNFAVGGILLDGSNEAEEGRVTLRQRMSKSRLATPLGLMVDPIAQHLYNLGAKDAFGRSRHLRCPHYSEGAGGNCTIWAHRNAVCYTWFCKHERGQVGNRFWNSLRDLLGCVEENLSVWCALEIGISHEAVVQAMKHRSESPQVQIGQEFVMSDCERSALWEGWLGREEAFYAECARIAGSLSWSQALETCGSAGKALWGSAKVAFDALLVRAPVRRPLLGTVEVSRVSETESSLGTYSPFNPLTVPHELTYLLHYFNGDPVESSVSRIKSEQEVDIELSLIERLFDFGVLLEGSSDPGSDPRANNSLASYGAARVQMAITPHIAPDPVNSPGASEAPR
jgi:hypothetical protein